MYVSSFESAANLFCVITGFCTKDSGLLITGFDEVCFRFGDLVTVLRYGRGGGVLVSGQGVGFVLPASIGEVLCVGSSSVCTDSSNV